MGRRLIRIRRDNGNTTLLKLHRRTLTLGRGKDEILEQPTESDKYSRLVSAQLTRIFLVTIRSVVVLSFPGRLVVSWAIVSVVSISATLPWPYRFHVAPTAYARISAISKAATASITTGSIIVRPTTAT